MTIILLETWYAPISWIGGIFLTIMLLYCILYGDRYKALDFLRSPIKYLKRKSTPEDL
jgi:hypothetical protein